MPQNRLVNLCKHKCYHSGCSCRHLLNLCMIVMMYTLLHMSMQLMKRCMQEILLVDWVLPICSARYASAYCLGQYHMGHISFAASRPGSPTQQEGGKGKGRSSCAFSNRALIVLHASMTAFWLSDAGILIRWQAPRVHCHDDNSKGPAA